MCRCSRASVPLVSCLKESLYYIERSGTVPDAHRTSEETVDVDR
jgi:hypothetical protein